MAKPEERIQGDFENRPMTLEEMNKCRAFYHLRTLQIRPVGDITQRKRTWEAFSLAAEARQIAKQGEATVAVESVMGILEDEGRHTLLGKVVAAIAVYDVAQENGLWSPDLSKRISAAFKRVHDQDGTAILAGALYARFQAYNLETDNRAAIDQLYLRVIRKEEGTPTRAEQKLACAIEGAKNAISEMLNEQMLSMLYPVSITYSAKRRSQPEGEYEYQEEYGYPDSTMHLGVIPGGRNRIPTRKKMREASLIGVPDETRHVLVKRVLRAKFGVERDERSSISSGDASIYLVEIKSLYHVHLPALERSGYCSLVYWAAVRVIRGLKEEFGGFDQETLDTLPEGYRKQYSSKNNKDKELAIEKAITSTSKWLKETGILSTAMAEYRALTGENIDEEEAIEILKVNLGVAVTWYDGGSILRLRNETSLARYHFTEPVWRSLNATDKINFILLSMGDRESPIWGLVRDDRDRERLDQIVKGERRIEEEETRFLLGLVERDIDFIHSFFVMRFETIRDKYPGPESLWEGNGDDE